MTLFGFLRGWTFDENPVIIKVPIASVTMHINCTFDRLSSPRMNFSKASWISGMKAKRVNHLVVDLRVSTAPRARSPSEKHVLANDIYISCFLAFQSSSAVCDLSCARMSSSVKRVRH